MRSRGVRQQNKTREGSDNNQHDKQSGSDDTGNKDELHLANAIDPQSVNIESFSSFFARASILTNLLQSQLAVPLLYPLNSKALGGDGIRLSSINNPKWSKETLAYGLAQVAPALGGLARVASVLRAGHAIRHFRGRSAETKMLNKTGIRDSSRVPQFNDNWHPKTKISTLIKAEKDSLHLPKKQVWTMRRPLFESETVHMGWRAHGPPPFIKGTSGI